MTLKASQSSNHSPENGAPVPIVTDLDGTLIRTDSLYEGLAAALSANLFNLFSLLKFSSPLALKEWVEKYAKPDAFPVNQKVYETLKDAKNSGRSVWLATGSPDFVARPIAEKLEIFDGVISSGNGENLVGSAKAEVLEAKFGRGGFDYIGDSSVDLPIWQASREAFFVGSEKRRQKISKALGKDLRPVSSPKIEARSISRLLRIHQWVKNLLVFLPIFLAHAFSIQHFILACYAFFSLGFCASAIYIVNDLCDLASDRIHPTKCRRPFASGAVPISWGPVLFIICIGLSAFFAAFLPPFFWLCLAIYLALTLAYSFYFKRRLFLDAIVLATLYVLRITAGAAALGLPLSNWLLGFASFLFCGLALLKRMGGMLLPSGTGQMPGRAYYYSDLPVVTGLAISSGLNAIVIMALYVDSLQAQSLYVRPELLWAICPILLWWFGRLTILTYRGEIHDDPVAYSVRDRKSWCAFFLIVLIFVASI